MGVSLKWGLQNSNFLTTDARHMKLSEYANIKKRSNLTKFGGIKMGVPLKQGRQNFVLLNH